MPVSRHRWVTASRTAGRPHRPPPAGGRATPSWLGSEAAPRGAPQPAVAPPQRPLSQALPALPRVPTACGDSSAQVGPEAWRRGAAGWAPAPGSPSCSQRPHFSPLLQAGFALRRRSGSTRLLHGGPLPAPFRLPISITAPHSPALCPPPSIPSSLHPTRPQMLQRGGMAGWSCLRFKTGGRGAGRGGRQGVALGLWTEAAAPPKVLDTGLWKSIP